MTYKGPNNYWIDHDDVVHIELENIHRQIIAEALIDISDLEIISGYRWYRHIKHRTSYAETVIYKPNTQIRISLSMHHLLMGSAPNPGLEIDHINGNGLNNRRINLRWATYSQNRMNSQLYRTTTSGFRGVTYHKRDRKWHARIKINWKSLSIGYFDNPEDAAKAYDKAALIFHKEFAQLNFPPNPSNG